MTAMMKIMLKIKIIKNIKKYIYVKQKQSPCE